MKVVVYQGNRKITIKNITIPYANLAQEEEEAEIMLNDASLYNFNITSQNNMADESDSLYEQDFKTEGINWRSETVN